VGRAGGPPAEAVVADLCREIHCRSGLELSTWTTLAYEGFAPVVPTWAVRSLWHERIAS